MKKAAYFCIDDVSTPRDASDVLSYAKGAGFDNVLVMQGRDANLSKAAYREKLLAVFRGALRHKVNLYLYDDNFKFSGTGMGQVCSVKDVWQKAMVVKNTAELSEDDVVLCEKDNKAVVLSYGEEWDECPYKHYPDLTNPLCAQMVIDSVYVPLAKEFGKFKGYEFKGFVCSSPLYGAGDWVCYSEEAIKRFKNKPDLFDIANKGKEYGEYSRLLRLCLEENFILPLKKFCRDNDMELIVCGGEGSVSHEFCNKEKLVYLSYEKEGIYPRAEDVHTALMAYAQRRDAVIGIMPGMDKISRIGEFFKDNSQGEIVEVTSFASADKDCYILVNSSSEVKSLGFLLEGEWSVADWEKDEVYTFEQKKTYTFYPDSFLCLKRKSDALYEEKLPARIGGVVCGEWEEAKKLSFNYDGKTAEFKLPEDSLKGKCVEIISSGDYLKVKMGYNEHILVTKPCIIPLYDFLCGSRCVAEGDITQIRILEQKRDS